MLTAAWWGGLAAASLLIGYALARRGLSLRTVGLVMGVGAGALISAIAYELVPESALTEASVVWPGAVAFTLGALAFFAGDWLIDHRGGADRKDIAGGQRTGPAQPIDLAQQAESHQPAGSGAAIFIGTLLDNVPESIILGMGLALGGAINIAFLAAVFISNLPEGVAGSLNLEASGYSRRQVFWLWLMLVLLSAASAGFGYAVAQRLPAVDGRYAQAFAAGAMLTMLADAMMPEAFEHGGKLVGLFTVFGFLLTALLSL